METADFSKYTGNEEHIRQTEELKKTLRADRNLLFLLQQYKVPESCIDESPWLIRRWYENFRPCIQCGGLQMCGQKTKGYFESIRYDGFADTEISACKYRRNEDSRLGHMKNYLVSDLTESQKTVLFDNIDLEGEKEEYLNVYAEALNLSSEDRSLYLHGSMGSGKTYLAVCAANDHARRGMKTAFIRYPAFCTRMASQVRDGEYRTELGRVMHADFLVIDDIGAENCTEFNRDQILFPILDHRYENGLATWFTSNCDIPSLTQHFTISSGRTEDSTKANRVVERITAMCKVTALTGKDRRKPL